ncbi:hypothetical protein AXI59_09020 [Bacillus nakamurai]|nr:hypothetical protein AXI59_09020 [Bacillus nakamurai]
MLCRLLSEREIIEKIAHLFQLAGADVHSAHQPFQWILSSIYSCRAACTICPGYSRSKDEKTIVNVIRDKKRRNFLVYSRIQLIIAQFVLGKVCICKIHV